MDFDFEVRLTEGVVELEFIAEIGLNHNGNLDLARRLIDAARNAGATTAKFQTYFTNERVAAGHPLSSILDSCRFTEKQFAQLRDHCRETGIEFLTTIFGLGSLRVATSLGLDRLKIASFSIGNTDLIETAVTQGFSLLVSTGAATLDEIMNCASLLGLDSRNHSFLHCISQYPVESATNLHMINVSTIRELTGIATGFSDHTAGTDSFFWATLAGAHVIEKHFTLDRNMEGPDHFFSATPEIFSEAVEKAKQALSILGERRINAYDVEKPILEFKSVVGDK